MAIQAENATATSSSTMARLAELVEKCNRCGFCQAGCPTYKVSGLEWQVARGRVALVRNLLEGRADLVEEEVKEAFGSCLRCGGCTVHCPPQVPTHELMDLVVEELARVKGEPWVQRVIFRGILPRKGLLDAAGKAIWFSQMSGAQGLASALGLTRVLGADAHRAQDTLPKLPSRTARQMLPTMMRHLPNRKYRVAYFIGCGTDLMFPEIAGSMLRVLYANDTEVLVPDVVDCGKPPMVYGDVEGARNLARVNVDALAGLDVDAIVSDCGTCGSFLKNYGELLSDDSEYADRARAVATKVKDVSEFLTGIEFNDRLGEVKAKISYHDPCHLGRFQKVTAQPRNLLKGVPGVEFVEAAEADMCCGGAGSFFLSHYDLSQQVLGRKMENVGRTGASYLVTGCPACMMQLASGVRKHDLPVRVIHTMQILDRAYASGK